MDWLNANKLSLNVNKSHFIIFQPKRKKLEYQITIKLNKQPIEQVSSTQFLGYIIDEEMTWKKHIGHLTKKLSNCPSQLVYLKKLGKHFTLLH